MHIHKLSLVAMFAAFAAVAPLEASVVTLTTGSTSGYTMTDGNTYVVSKSLTFSNSTAGGSGMSVANNATVVLYVPAGVTLTASLKRPLSSLPAKEPSMRRAGMPEMEEMGQMGAKGQHPLDAMKVQTIVRKEIVELVALVALAEEAVVLPLVEMGGRAER